MTAKEYLQQVAKAEAEIERIQYKIEHFDSLVNSMNMGYDADRVQTSKVDNDPAFAKFINMKIDAEAELKSALNYYEEIYKEVDNTIKTVGGVEGHVLFMRHINRMSIDEIAEEKGYSFDGIRKIYDRGLEQVEVLLAENNENCTTDYQ